MSESFWDRTRRIARDQNISWTQAREIAYAELRLEKRKEVMRMKPHVEPRCLADGNGCTYQEVHNHGLPCDNSCKECHGDCHPYCPRFEEALAEEVRRGA